MKKKMISLTLVFAIILAMVVPMYAFAATVGQKLTAPEAGWKRYDDTDARLKYNGSFYVYVGSSVDYNGTGHWIENVPSASVDFKFKGTKLRFIYAKHNLASNSVRVTIDGVPETYSEYSNVSVDKSERQILLYEKTGLPDTEHTVHVEAISPGSWGMDAIDIDDTGYLITMVGQKLTTPEPGWKRFDETDTRIKYSGDFLVSTVNNGNTVDYNRTGHWTQTEQSAGVDFKFKGTKLRFIYAKHNLSSNSVRVTIDGVPETYSEYSNVSVDKSERQILLYEKTGLPDTEHTVHVEAITPGAWGMDAIDIDDTGDLINSTPNSNPNPNPTAGLTLGFFESAINNGSISGTYTLALPQGTFVGDVASGLTVTGLPEGLHASVSPFNESVVLVNFTGQAARHSSGDSVYNAFITVKKENISGATSDLTTAPFAIVFKDNTPVPPTPPSDFLDFDGVDDTVKATDLRVNTAPGGKNTVEFWMYAEGRSVRMPFGWNTKYDLAFGASSFGFNTGESNNIVGISSEGLYDKWVHVAAVFTNDTPSPSNLELYINGVKQTLTVREGSAPSSPRTVTSTVYMSGYGDRTTNKFDGKLADVRIWNYARTQDEIAAGINSVLTGNETGLVGYWKLGNFTTEKAYDSAADRHHGIGYGFTTPQLNLRTTEVTSNRATLAWDALPGADKYVLKRDGTTVYEGSSPTFVDVGLASNRAYMYTVSAANNKGESITSPLSVTTNN